MSDRFNSIHAHSDTAPSGKVTLSDNCDFRYFISLQPIAGPVGGYSFTITSQWESASRPKEEQVRFRACLDRNGLERLHTLIEQELAS